MANYDKNGIPYSCPLIDDVIHIIKNSSIEEADEIISLMEKIRKINDDLRGVCKDFYNEKEDAIYELKQLQKQM